MWCMVELRADTTATFFFVTDARATDRTRADSPLAFAVDSSGPPFWWYTAPARPPRPAPVRER